MANFADFKFKIKKSTVKLNIAAYQLLVLFFRQVQELLKGNKLHLKPFFFPRSVNNIANLAEAKRYPG